ncbi:MAG: sugar phosphate isomerase/epimerase, partial [Paenibacillaceae bacterium]|nr:sugar phosphate isomerase/epimerase [Paenibacillaceae bacterium]
MLYYNHNWEFERFDGKYVIELLMEETDPEWVKFEPDVYWIKRGGEDPAEFLRKLAGRCPLVHIKDMEPGEEQFFAEIGEGIIDFHQVADRAKEAGAEWLVVEQDRC